MAVPPNIHPQENREIQTKARKLTNLLTDDLLLLVVGSESLRNIIRLPNSPNSKQIRPE